MSEIPKDTRKALDELSDMATAIERNRCIEIVKAIEPHNEAEAHLIETIVRRMRGEE